MNNSILQAKTSIINIKYSKYYDSKNNYPLIHINH
ncbi:hypothetical protein C8D70_11140 [Chryseobacterium sp. CBTAP 102]|nr:hypothetical protein C8D70_11140 [Chryseobacterium sp. CBTAP 102]SIQ82937.1 hypothetical protein SAMN05880573_11123 [Chryseobacterium sp. RU33C]